MGRRTGGEGAEKKKGRDETADGRASEGRASSKRGTQKRERLFVSSAGPPVVREVKTGVKRREKTLT